jgi:hypothetical protein
MIDLRETAPRARRFADDNSGAIAVLGILIGAVLVALLFHLMNCGFGILWREQAQDAADATAFEAAVWNARGMNVLVAINIFIALVMAVLIFWRVCILFMMVVTGLSIVACPFQEEFCGMVEPLTTGVSDMLELDPTLAGRVYQVIAMLHDSQKIVAAATPVMGTLSSVTVAKKFGADFGIGFGTQLIPTVSFSSGNSPKKSCKPNALLHSNLTGSWGDQLGKPVSLPVKESDDLNTLCAMGGRMQAMILWYIVSKVGDALHLPALSKTGQQEGGGKFGDIWSTITGGNANFFCGDFMGIVTKTIQDAVNSRCGGNQTCLDAANKAQTANPLPQPGQTSKIDSSKAKWTDIWDLAQNGNLFMQSWSYVSSERKNMTTLDKGVQIADFLGGAKGGSSDGYKVDEKGATFAGAEMYFDCESEWSDDECVTRAPWRMAWRARLRRVHDPVDFITSDLGQTMVNALYGGLDGHFGGEIADKFSPVAASLTANAGRLIPIQPSSDFQTERDRLARTLAPASSDGSTSAVRSAAAWVHDETAAGIPELIH